MAHYAYKNVLAIIPQDFKDKWAASWLAETGREPEWTADYDGDLWNLASAYIWHLQGIVRRVEEKLTSIIEAHEKRKAGAN